MSRLCTGGEGEIKNTKMEDGMSQKTNKQTKTKKTKRGPGSAAPLIVNVCVRVSPECRQLFFFNNILCFLQYLGYVLLLLLLRPALKAVRDL